MLVKKIGKKLSVSLQQSEIDKNLNFNNHISAICQKVNNKLNAIS